jgi:D-alanine-D-alanine ligase-like ATP-grasp enzyme
MQKQADETLPRSAGRIRLMADESLWDADDFRRLRRAGGVAAVNIKVPKAGGLRPALALARTVHKTAPETLVYLGGMVGTSDITGRALYNVALTFPRIDHCTAFPAENLTGNPATRRLVESSEGGVRRIDLGDGAGIGTDIDLDALAAFQVARYSAGGQASVDYVRDESTGANVYAPSPLLALTQHELDSHLMEREALLMGFSTVRTSPRQFEMRDAEGGSVSFYWTVVRRLPETTRDICKRKYESKLRFMKNSVPVAEGRLFETGEIEAASAYARGLGWPVVVKPGIGTGGVGVSANIRSDKELAQAFEVIRTGEKVRSRNDGTMIVERHVDGTELRVFVADGRVVGAVRKLGVHVVGDGQKTIKALVDEKNARRRSNPRLANTRIRLGNVACAQLARQELTPDSVPAEGRTVSLSTVASISQGADMVGVLDEVHPTVLDAAVRAAGSIPHLRTCGLDIIVPDHTAPLESDKACVCEANISPSIAAAHFPVYGQPVSVAKAFVESVARARKLTPGEAGADVAVTISLSLPSVPDDALTKRLAAYFRQNGMAGGLATEDGKVTIWARGTPLACCALPAILSGMPGDDAKSRRIESVIVRMSDSRWEEKCGTFATDFSKVALPRPEGPLFWRRARNLAGRAVRRAARMVRPARRR